MEPIKKALVDELHEKTLSKKTKQQILQHKQLKKYIWLPKVAAACVAVLALFLVVTTIGQKPSDPSSTTAPMGSVDEAILTYYNEQVIREPSDFYSGDAYLMRLALEKNSRLFYEDSTLSLANRLLVSELLHYVQEASWQEEASYTLEPVRSMDELVVQADAIIAELKPQVSLPYMSIADEKKHQWKFYSYDTKAWVSYIVVLAFLLFVLIKFRRGKHWILFACCAVVFGISAYLPFTKPYAQEAVYDEASIVNVVTKHLQDMNVKVSGEPVLKYAATMHETRSALVAFDDFKVLATFTYEKGQYVQQTMNWHTAQLFRDTAFDSLNEPLQQISVLGFLDEHDVATLQIKGEGGYRQEIPINPNESTIVFYKKPQNLTSYGVFYLDEQGNQVN